MLETIEFQRVKGYVETNHPNENIIEDIVYTCNKKGIYVVNWDLLDRCSLIVIYNNYTYDLFILDE